MTRMECLKVTWIRTGRLHQDLSWKNHLLLFLSLWSIRVSFLFARAYSKPFWKSCFWSLLPFRKFVLPCLFQSFGPENLCTTFIELFPVSISPGVSPSLILGEHVYCWRMSSSEGLRVQPFLDGLVPQLKFLPFC